MKHIIAICSCIVLFCLLLVSLLFLLVRNDRRFTGRIVATDGRPVPNAAVSFVKFVPGPDVTKGAASQTVQVVFTDSDGRFTFDCQTGVAKILEVKDSREFKYRYCGDDIVFAGGSSASTGAGKKVYNPRSRAPFELRLDADFVRE